MSGMSEMAVAIWLNWIRFFWKKDRRVLQVIETRDEDRNSLIEGTFQITE
ncbi:MAG: hypothetical protein ACLVH3_15700 [Blautia obeum]